MWFDSWADVARVLAVGTAAYLTVVVVLRFSGKRTLAKLNAYDLVVTVALGSTLATILLNSQVSWADGATALALLATLQLVLRQAVRASGRGALEDVAAVVLETDGTLSVIGADRAGSGSALEDLPDF